MSKKNYLTAKKVMLKSGQMSWNSKLKDGKELQKRRMIHSVINSTNVVHQNQEIFLDQEEEGYNFLNSFIPEEPSKFSKYGLNTSLIIVKGFLSRKNL